MGLCESKEEREKRETNNEIEKSIEKEQQKMGKKIKILLLGPSESGKSTVVKQMKIIYMNGFTTAERLSFKRIIFNNTVQSMKEILNTMGKLNVQITDRKALECVSIVKDSALDFSDSEVLPGELSTAMEYLWNKCGIQNVHHRLCKISNLIDSAPYFFDNIKRIGGPKYVPSVDDVLRARSRTTGIVETTFKTGRVDINMIDVGGQRSERRKWIYCFEDVTSVIFIASLSEYDQMHEEEPDKNRMLESLELFQSISNSKWFTHSSVILFLNKRDLFTEKLKISPLNDIFPKFKGGSDYEKASAYIKKRFLVLSCTEKAIYTHFTCATDTKQIELVFAAVRETTLKKAFAVSGII